VSHSLRASAETRLSKKTWAAPEAVWVPLRRAVFAYYKGGKWSPVDGALLREWKEILATESGAQKIEIKLTPLIFSFSYVEDGAETFTGAPWQLLEGKAARKAATSGSDIEGDGRSERRLVAVREATECSREPKFDRRQTAQPRSPSHRP
jgi:hypothetical protein